MSGWLIFAAAWRLARLRRRAGLDQYLVVSSPWHARWRGWLADEPLAFFGARRLAGICSCWVKLLIGQPGCGLFGRSLPLLWIIGSCSGAGCKGARQRPLLDQFDARLWCLWAGCVAIRIPVGVHSNIANEYWQG